MHIQHILVTGRLKSQIKQEIENRDLPQTFRFLEEQEVTSADFLWADAYVNFYPIPQFQWGNLRWVHSLGAGVDRFIDLKEWKNDVVLTRTICSFGQKISEYCLSYILQDLQHHHLFQKQQEASEWTPVTPKTLSSQRVVIYGTGEIGQEVARVFSQLGTEVIGVSLSGQKKAHFKHVYKISERSDFLQETDWVISTLPLTEQTYQLFNHQLFQSLSGAGFINVGRGATVVEESLLWALEQPFLRKAVLDVFEEEPLSPESPLWKDERVTITPHISAVTSAEEGIACFLDTLEKINANQILHNQVDLEKGY
ncbi:D-2-hydroxyacid dehydrogenase [Priestia koreensis]|uniref:Dihydrofolate reductase n=1 Tax=Priestia koreensis TaxID=284581 RepID=A0A0M0KR82_9BACI|nr:D-2-hydroxyacid dehydrogenase [Priestia koreensis]KOO41107.1 dihydrofolate reductase [Priestia koreensis]